MSEQQTHADKRFYDMIFVIVNIGKASRVLAEAKTQGVSGGTMTLGLGTISSGLLRKLGFHEVRKEILIMACERERTLPVIDHLARTFHLEQPNHGIIFSTPLVSLVGTHGERLEMEREDEHPVTTHELFLTIVPEGDGGTILEAVQAAGASGGTLLHGLGTFAETVTKVFGIELSSRKDIVLNLVPLELADAVEQALLDNYPFEGKDTGIFFSVEAENVRGIHPSLQ